MKNLITTALLNYLKSVSELLNFVIAFVKNCRVKESIFSKKVNSVFKLGG